MKHMQVWNRWFLIAGILCLFLFTGFSKEVKHGTFGAIDFATTVKIQDRMPRRFDELWEDAAFFVTPMPSVVLVGVLTIVGFVVADSTKRRLAVFMIPLLFGFMILAEVYGKSVVHHPAPPFFMIKNPTTVFPRYYINEQFSYPSGHTARAVFLGGIVFGIASMVLGRRKTMLVMVGSIAYCLIVAIGRIYVGHHWLTDIIGGVLLGGGFFLVSLGGLFNTYRS